MLCWVDRSCSTDEHFQPQPPKREENGLYSDRYGLAARGRPKGPRDLTKTFRFQEERLT